MLDSYIGILTVGPGMTSVASRGRWLLGTRQRNRLFYWGFRENNQSLCALFEVGSYIIDFGIPDKEVVEGFDASFS